MAMPIAHSRITYDWFITVEETNCANGLIAAKSEITRGEKCSSLPFASLCSTLPLLATVTVEHLSFANAKTNIDTPFRISVKQHQLATPPRVCSFP